MSSSSPVAGCGARGRAARGLRGAAGVLAARRGARPRPVRRRRRRLRLRPARARHGRRRQPEETQDARCARFDAVQGLRDLAMNMLTKQVGN